MIQITTVFDRYASAKPATSRDTDLLTDELRGHFDGPLSFPVSRTLQRPEGRPYVVSNFVGSLDGVASYQLPGQSSGALIAGGNDGDQFVMGLLRSAADAVVVGAETVAQEGGLPRIAEVAYPPAAHAYAAMRQALGKSPYPYNIILSRSGCVDLQQPIFHTPGLEVVILTTETGRNLLCGAGGISPDSVVSLGSGSVNPAHALRYLRDHCGVQLCLLEGGPTVMGQFMEPRLVDEIFLTISPRVAGRDHDQPRPGMVQSAAFAPGNSPIFDLVTLKRQDSHVLCRYRAQ